MRIYNLFMAFAAAVALVAVPVASAEACDAHAQGGVKVAHAHHAAPSKGGKKAVESDCCKPAAKPAPKAAADDCCKPAAKPAPKAAADDCCKPAAAKSSCDASCAGNCSPEMKAACGGKCSPEMKAACATMAKAKRKAACAGDCKGTAGGACACPDKAACGDACKGGKAACAGGCKDKAYAHHGKRKGHAQVSYELRGMPALAGVKNQHVVFSRERAMAYTDSFSVAAQMNLGVQLGADSGFGPWVTPHAGIVPRLGKDFGAYRLQAGALLGGGAMFRTAQGSTPAGLLQAQPFWAVQPQVSLDWNLHHHMAGGLTLGYMLTPVMADFGGPSVGLRWTWKHGR